MTLVEFLIAILETHAKALGVIESQVGQERLLQILEIVSENLEANPIEISFKWECFQKINSWIREDPYFQLESAVRDFKLVPQTEFYLWNYPYYREFIESAIPLQGSLQTVTLESRQQLIDSAFLFAQEWYKRLLLPSNLRLQIEPAMTALWLKFRTQMYKKTGIQPLSSVVLKD